MKYLSIVLSVALLLQTADAAPPRVLIEGCRLEQVAREPEIVTPVGMTFDGQGRLLVIESHTHQAADDYPGPQGDRLRAMQFSNEAGAASSWSTVAEGFHHAMNVAAGKDGSVYVVSRGEVSLLADRDQDGKFEDKRRVLWLDTEADYPHNALSGIALHGDRLYLGLGENFGMNYRLVGSDGQEISGSGGAGTIFHCTPDGTQLQRFATGFWNPFGLCTANDRLYAVDNDPDASPPCRLIDVVERGDYGYRYEYGRAGVHPLQAWNGELPGTLPMVCGTGEAPTAVVAHRGYLWVTSWGDHRLERYELQQGADGSLTAQMTVVVQGEADFRPTGLAVAPDGSLYFGDWVLRDYAVHGKGRIWKLTLPDDLQATLPEPRSHEHVADGELHKLERLRWEGELSKQQRQETLREALLSPDAEIRLFAVRCIAEQRLVGFVNDLNRLLDGEIPNDRYYLAVLGALDWLEGGYGPRHGGIADGLLMRELRSSSRSDTAKALALTLISPDYKDVTIGLLEQWIAEGSPDLQLTAVRALARRVDEARFAALIEVVESESSSEQLRAEAMVGLSAAWQRFLPTFTGLASSENETLRSEAERVLRLAGKTAPVMEEVPSTEDLAAWQELLAQPGNAEAGRRLFFSPLAPNCSVCHRHQGQGGQVGPDLSTLATVSDRDKIIESILQPSREVAPHYQPVVLLTDAGKMHVGLRLPKSGDDGRETYIDTAGQRFELDSDSIELRQPSPNSLMPSGLEKSMTIAELRDLVTFLSGAPERTDSASQKRE